MLVAMVTAPRWPARATISASCWWYLALSTACTMPVRRSMRLSTSEDSTETVPTSTGWPLAWASWIALMTAPNFSRRVLKMRSLASLRMQGLFVGTTVQASL